MKLIPKPMPGEYAPYTVMYIGLLPDDGRILEHLRKNLENTVRFIRALPKGKLTTPHAETPLALLRGASQTPAVGRLANKVHSS